MIHRYFGMLIEEEYRDTPGKMKQFASWFTHGVRGGASCARRSTSRTTSARSWTKSSDSSKACPALTKAMKARLMRMGPRRFRAPQSLIDEAAVRRVRPKYGTPGPHRMSAAPKWCRNGKHRSEGNIQQRQEGKGEGAAIAPTRLA